MNAEVAWAGPGNMVRMDLTPLLAAQLAVVLDHPEVIAARQRHPLAYAGIAELREKIDQVMAQYHANYWERTLPPAEPLPERTPGEAKAATEKADAIAASKDLRDVRFKTGRVPMPGAGRAVQPRGLQGTGIMLGQGHRAVND